LLIFKDATPNLLESSAIALGFFDGVHLGHSFVIKSMIKKAQKAGLTPCVVTFSNHPLEILKNTKITSIVPLEKRLELLQNLGVEAVLILDFSKELIALSAEAYLKNILVDSLHPKFITLGFNHCFGASKKGNADFLRNNSQKYGYEVLEIPPVELNSTVISSSLIKKCILNSDFESASQYLGRDFSISGEVIKGRQIGRTIGFATANLLQDENLVEIPNGVYSGWAKVQGKKHKAMINVGTAPTLKGGVKTVEAHLLNFDRDIYYQTIEVGFAHKIRDEKEFASKEELVAQITKDCIRV
jgi:riboflavin kinase/FMN adenylyltransferase